MQWLPDEDATYRPYQWRGRFVVEPIGPRGEGWNLIDDLDGGCLEFHTKAEAEAAATFARAYVRKYGDIDLNSFPYDLESPVSYAEDTERPWPPLSDSTPVQSPP
jgi:hypothetical protein